MDTPAGNDSQSAVAALTHLYGRQAAEAMSKPAGVVHVTAVWRDATSHRGPQEPYVALRINKDTPKSTWDFFVLNAARARADAIVTTGKILRDEPDLQLDIMGAGNQALLRWRREVLGKTKPPYVLILTSGRGLPTDQALADWHPALRSWAVPILYTQKSSTRALLSDPGDRVRIVDVDAPSVHGAIDYLRQELGCQTISIEAGPSTVNALYRDPIAIDELLLSVFHGERIPASVCGAPFVKPQRLRDIFGPLAPNETAPSANVAVVDEPSGPWRFHRLTRR